MKGLVENVDFSFNAIARGPREKLGQSKNFTTTLFLKTPFLGVMDKSAFFAMSEIERNRCGR